MIGFSFKGKHSSEFNIGVRSVDRSFLPGKRKKQIIIPGMSGSIDFDDDTYENRPIEVEIGLIKIFNFVDLRQVCREVAGWLNGSGKLIFDDEPDKYYLASIYSPSGIKQLPLSPRGIVGISFECQPFAYMAVDTGEDLTWEQADFPWITDAYWNMVESYQFVATGTKSFTFNNPGTREINFKSPQGSKSLIKINGSWTNLNISLNGNILTYTQPSTGELIIDNVEMETTLNGTNALSAIDGDIEEFLEITPGDNIISISGTNINVEVIIDFVAMWI